MNMANALKMRLNYQILARGRQAVSRAFLFLVFIMVLLVSSSVAYAQIIQHKIVIQKGTIRDAETGEPLYKATVLDLFSQTTTVTDEQGNYSLRVKDNDSLTFSMTGYASISRKVDPGSEMNIELSHLAIQLPTYTLRSYTPFQLDSIEMTNRYSKELHQNSVKPGYSPANGGGFTGVIGGPIQKLSKSYRQNKRFQQTFWNDMQQKYVDTKYTPTLVHSLTGLTGDTLAMFMNSYPMEYGFARVATDLEIKMWIRTNFKEYADHDAIGTYFANKPRVR
jgi:hypothetical protein